LVAERVWDLVPWWQRGWGLEVCEAMLIKAACEGSQQQARKSDMIEGKVNMTSHAKERRELERSDCFKSDMFEGEVIAFVHSHP